MDSARYNWLFNWFSKLFHILAQLNWMVTYCISKLSLFPDLDCIYGAERRGSRSRKICD